MKIINLRSTARRVATGDLVAAARRGEAHFGPVVAVNPVDDFGTAMVRDASGATRRFSPVADLLLRPTEVSVGDAATIHLYTDTFAAVVVKVTKTQVHVRRVATTEAVEVSRKGPWPVMEAEGVLTEAEGDVQVFRVGKHGALAGGGDRSVRLTLGRSVSRTDYSY